MQVTFGWLQDGLWLRLELHHYPHPAFRQSKPEGGLLAGHANVIDQLRFLRMPVTCL